MSENEQTGHGADKDIPPWLQPVPEEEEAEGFFQGKKTLIITATAALSVVILFVLVLLYLYDGANDGPPRHIVADTTPVREKPAEPGGMDVPYQDKQVFDQGAGSATDQVKLADQPEEPLAELPAEPEEDAPEGIGDIIQQAAMDDEEEPASDPVPAAVPTAPASKPETKVSEPEPVAVPAGAYKVQLGAYGSEESAQRAWRTILGKHRAILEGLSPLYEAVQAGDRKLVRLRLGPLENRAAADEVCLGLRAQQQACIVVNP